MTLEKRLKDDYRFATISTSVRDTRVPGAILSVTNPQSASRLLWSSRACMHATIDTICDLASRASGACYKGYVCVCVCGECLCGVGLLYRNGPVRCVARATFCQGEGGDEVALEDGGDEVVATVGVWVG
eukprot:6997086-Prymnesium_polylepis.1